MGAVTDFIKQYWWVWLILGLLFFYFFIWKQFDNYTKNKIARFFTGSKIVIIGFILAWILWHYVWPNSVTTQHISNFWIPMAGAVFVIVTLEIIALRYGTKQLIAPNFHGSYGKIDEVNGFWIFAVDSIKIFDVVLFTKRIVIVKNIIVKS